MSLICRTCTQINKKCVSILGYHKNGKLLSDMLVEFARIKVRENDGLPLYICNGCLEKLTTAWDFRAMIIEADSKLHDFFNNHIKENVVHSNNSHINMTIVKEEIGIVKREISDSLIAENRCISNSSRPECPLKKIACESIDIHSSSPEDETKDNSDKILVKNEDDSNKNLFENYNVIPKITAKKSIKKRRIMSTHSKSDNVVGIPSNLKQSDATNLSNSPFCRAALTDRNINEANDSNESSTKDKIEEVETIKQTDIIGGTRSENNSIIDEQDNEMLEEICQYSSDDTNNSDTSLRNTMDVEFGSDKVTRKLTKKEKSKMSVFCKQCNRSFGYRYYFEIHVKHHNGDKKWKCSICGKGFVRQFQLRLHMRVHSGERPFSCETCGKTFKYQGQLHSHKSLHSDDTQYICSICQKSFKAKNLLRAHLQRHDTEKKFTCEVCGRAYNDPSAFSKHKLTHVDGKKFPCPTCGKAFTTNLQMRAHLKLHSEARLHSCNYCGKAFKTKDVMDSHILIHTGERPYSCKICDKSFRQTSTLYNHMRIHTGETPYVCQLCPAQFKYSHHLQNHMKVHK